MAEAVEEAAVEAEVVAEAAEETVAEAEVVEVFETQTLGDVNHTFQLNLTLLDVSSAIIQKTDERTNTVNCEVWKNDRLDVVLCTRGG